MIIKIPFGLRNGKVVHISELSEAERGLRCNCVCPQCRIPLVARMGPIRTRYFAHQNEDCKYAIETALHLFAKEVLDQQKEVRLPKVTYRYLEYSGELHPETYITFDEVILEKRLGDIIPDIILKKQNSELIVEVKVTHGIDNEKYNKIKLLNISTLEIDLSSNKFSHASFNREEMARTIINEVECKKWVFNLKLEEKILELRRENEVKKVKWENEQKRLIQAEEAKRKQKRDIIKRLTDTDYQAEVRELWSKELTNNPLWIKSASYLRLRSNQVPIYLNQDICGDIVFNCDRRIWQVTLFGIFIYKKLRKGKSQYFCIEHVVHWLKKKPYPLPLNWELTYLKDIEEYRDYPALSNVVAEFFLNLAQYGFVKLSDLTTLKGGGSYYWWFERLDDNFKVLPSRYADSDRFVERGNNLVNGQTGEVIGALAEIYVNRSL